VIKVKKTILSIFVMALLLSLFTFPVQAETYSFKQENLGIDFSDEYTVLTPSNLNKNSDIVEAIGHSVTSLKTNMQNNGIILMAVTDKNQHQIQLKSATTTFTSEIVSLSSLSGTQLDTVATQLVGKDYEVAYKNNIVFLKIKTLTSEYTSVQYVTVENGKLYTLVYYGADLSRLDTVLNSLIITEISGFSLLDGTTVLQIVLISIVIVAVMVAVVLLIISFIKDYKDRNGENDVRDYIKIKRRKF